MALNLSLRAFIQPRPCLLRSDQLAQPTLGAQANLRGIDFQSLVLAMRP